MQLRVKEFAVACISGTPWTHSIQVFYAVHFVNLHFVSLLGDSTHFSRFWGNEVVFFFSRRFVWFETSFDFCGLVCEWELSTQRRMQISRTTELNGCFLASCARSTVSFHFGQKNLNLTSRGVALLFWLFSQACCGTVMFLNVLLCTFDTLEVQMKFQQWGWCAWSVVLIFWSVVK